MVRFRKFKLQSTTIKLRQQDAALSFFFNFHKEKVTSTSHSFFTSKIAKSLVTLVERRSSTLFLSNFGLQTSSLAGLALYKISPEKV